MPFITPKVAEAKPIVDNDIMKSSSKEGISDTSRIGMLPMGVKEAGKTKSRKQRDIEEALKEIGD
jgi:hypothetical protein